MDVDEGSVLIVDDDLNLYMLFEVLFNDGVGWLLVLLDICWISGNREFFWLLVVLFELEFFYFWSVL